MRAAHRRVARDRRQQLEHLGPFAELALLFGLLEGGDRVGSREFAWFCHRFACLGPGRRLEPPGQLAERFPRARAVSTSRISTCSAPETASATTSPRSASRAWWIC